MPNIHAQVAVRKSCGAANKSNTGQTKEDGRHIEGWSGRWRDSLKALLPEELRSLRNIAQYMPLVAAIAAPMSSLMDIPALSQHWYSYYGNVQRDPTVCLCLSAVGLGFNVLANVLLLVRFSATKKSFWRWGVKLSLLCWITKTIIAIVNLLVFGAGQRNGPGYSYDQGFWCAVVSCVISGFISFCLLVHYILVFGRPEWDKEEIRLEGRKFMLSVTTFIGLIGIQAMVFNFIEEWGYLNAIYFSVQTALTVGYGDFVPTTAVGKVLIFPFAVLTISLLANEVSIIIDFIQNRAQDKRDTWRKNYAVAMHKEALARQPYATLIDEMSLIHQINLHQETMVQLYDLFWSGFALAAFWLIGAVIFHFLEGWGYGNTLYALMITCLTIGFGDFTPISPAGRVVWIIYALMAVPIVTSFAVQTVTGILYTWSEHRFTKARFNLVRQRDPEVFAPHSHFVLKMHTKWDKVRRKYMRAFAQGQDGQISVDAVRQAVLGAPPTQGTKVAATASATKPLPASTIDEKGSPVESQRRLLEPSVDGEKDSAEGGEPTDESTAEKQAQDTVVEDMLDSSDTRADVVEALGGEDLAGDHANGNGGDASGNSSDTDGASGKGSTTTQSNSPSSAPSAAASTTGGDDSIEVLDTVTETGSAPGASTADKVAGSPIQRTVKRPIQSSSPPSQGSTPAVPSASVVSASADPTNTTPSTLGSIGSQLAQHEADTVAHAEQERAARKAAGEPEPADDDVCAPARDKGDTSMEYQLIKSLVDRVTRLEAQARQMLIDSMDKDLARTLLLADRNLQVRDAFRLYDQGIDVEKTYREEAEKARKEADEAKRDGGDDDQDDMLSRVRRYRSTFAEILVISSTLLRLEGDDLKQFERWHVGDLHHHKREPNLLTHGLESPKGMRGAQQRAYSWAKDKKDHTVRVRDILLGSVRRKSKPSGSGSATPHRPSSRASSHRRRQGGQRRRSTVGRLVTDSESEEGDIVETHADPYDVPAPGQTEPAPPPPAGPSKLPIRATVHPSLNLHIPARSETMTSPTTASADTPTDYNEYNRGPRRSSVKDHHKARMLKIFDHHAQGVLDDAQKESKAISSTLTQPTKNMVARDAAVVYHAAEHVFKEVFMPTAAKREDEADIGRADDEREAEMKRDDALSQKREEKELEEEEEEDHGSPVKAPPRASSSKVGGSGSKHKTSTKTDSGSSKG
ncbi:Outward-rectifier potassium channel TOK1 [Vanrija pseudolonga]|uniref:Outward-rectifier potassium channel TOK1 n=1 Tax=Vanrija pseudolonga TaxID=143232 RepID=A0AAF1BLW7_9TREE|nr:Outward-rectifier potassium channel TOK1 [Vanrija pseudolonga]